MSFSDFHAAWPLACAAAPTKDTRIENLKDGFDVRGHSTTTWTRRGEGKGVFLDVHVDKNFVQL